MKQSATFLQSLQNRLKIGNRKGVHLNAIPSNSRYKLDISKLDILDASMSENFLKELFSKPNFKFKTRWNITKSILAEQKKEAEKVAKSFDNLINQTETIELEKGVNTFGFGYPLLIRKDKSDDKLTVAPLVIWSLYVKRGKEYNTWEIAKTENDPIYFNEILINHLQADAKISIDSISDEMLQDGFIDETELSKICSSVISALNMKLENDLVPAFTKASPILKKTDYEKLVTEKNNYIINSGLFSIFEVQKQSIIKNYDELLSNPDFNLDEEDVFETNFQPLTSVKTDPSQQNILNSLSKKNKIVIQGPPGTGKSQTLTAILINALENHKKTIVVCEKRTALDVLNEALKKKNLAQHCVLIRDAIKDRLTVVNSVRNRIENYGKKYYKVPSKTELNILHEKANKDISIINSNYQFLDQKLLGNYNWSDLVGLLLKIKNENPKISILGLDKNKFSFTLEELSATLEIIKNAERQYSEFQPIENNSIFNSEKLVGNIIQTEQQIHEDFKNYELLLNEIRDLETKCKEDYKEIRRRDFQNEIQKFEIANDDLSSIFFKNQNNNSFFNNESDGLIYQVISIFSNNHKNIIEDKERSKNLFVSLEKNDLGFKISEDFRTSKKALEFLLNNKESLQNQYFSKIDNEIAHLDLLALDSNYSTENILEFKKKGNDLKSKINNDFWLKNLNLGKNHQELFAEIERIISNKNTYLNQEKDVLGIEIKWNQFYSNLSDFQKIIIQELKNKNDWKSHFLYFYYNAILLKASSNLGLDCDYNNIQNISNELEHSQINYINEYWENEQVNVKNAFDQDKSNSLITEKLFNKRAGKKHKRLSLRQIVQTNKDLFTTFFPIILTTPDVCSNLFSNSDQYFDIVLFDEASQLRIEDTFPALLKGKQVIIAGDEHQMPPSNYFAKVFDGEIEDEDDLEDEISTVKKDDLLLSSESLLEFAGELNYDKRFLDFHYRSRHPYLIDFSNSAFYGNRLLPLPSKSEYIPIIYHNVEGRFIDYCNEEEALKVIEILENIENLPNGEKPSVGVATFNIHQRDYIRQKIYEKQQNNPAFNQLILELEKKGFFVKNLENIQGDERDIIVLSTTYGKGKNDIFVQRFGPINQSSKGYKLLNVIITRAKYKVIVITSIPEDKFINFKEYLEVEGNNKKAVFYAYLAYAKAVSENNDIERENILRALSSNENDKRKENATETENIFLDFVYGTLENNIPLQKNAKIGGYTIDILHEPKKIAFDCDGAKNKQSKEVYLEDLQKKQVLESLGYKYHVISSVDWYRNAEKEKLNFLKIFERINFC